MGTLAGRHRDIETTLLRRYHEFVLPFAGNTVLDLGQSLLAGAYFAEEYSFEAAALFNPSVVPHPDQSGVQDGALRLILSLRAVGEGQISSVTFRTGLLSREGSLTIDPPSRYAISPQIEHVPGGGQDGTNLRLRFGDHGDLSELVLFPVSFQQRQGIEDLRLVRFVDDDGETSYIGTYTAFSGSAIRQELLKTSDFATFELAALRGDLVATKGMALFPRRIAGQFAMLGRNDHENIWLLMSDDLYRWDAGKVILTPQWPWEFVQIGTCSAPLEIEAGWLFISHGVGAVRNYCLGACLLDKDDPSKVLARSVEPLVQPHCMNRDGFVPNVAYSCGALIHEDTLLLPYGVADSFTTFQTWSLQDLLKTLR